VFIKLGPKHASKDEVELVVFEFLGEFLLVVPVLSLLLAVLSSKLRLAVLLLVHFVGYSAHRSKHAINTRTQYLPAELEERINGKGRSLNYLWEFGEWIGENKPGKDVVKFGINLGYNGA
jgi:hypothetical protein